MEEYPHTSKRNQNVGRLITAIHARGALPRHVAITMDGNGRWAQQRNRPRSQGHEAGAKRALEIIEVSLQLKLEVLTLYAFSFENWKRDSQEVAFLMEDLFPRMLSDLCNHPLLEHLHIRVMGTLDRLPPHVHSLLEDVSQRTRENTGLTLNIAISYSGRNEIIDACRKLCVALLDGRVNLPQIDQTYFEQHLYTVGLPDPDLHIRCGGVHRLSNFMLWQMAYTELLPVDILWPDFSDVDYLQCILHFQQQPRKFGTVLG